MKQDVKAKCGCYVVWSEASPRGWVVVASFFSCFAKHEQGEAVSEDLWPPTGKAPSHA